MLRRVGTPPFFLGLAAPVTAAQSVWPTTGHGSAAAFARCAHPSLRYFVHLNAPGWNVIGATAPWQPGVAEGHNDRLAWTAEPIDADTQDVYVEKLNPANPRQVEDAGRWVDIDVRKGLIAVRGRKTPVDFTSETTRHGVIVASDRERHLAFAVRWSGSEPGTAAELAAHRPRSRRLRRRSFGGARALEDAGAPNHLPMRRHARRPRSPAGAGAARVERRAAGARLDRRRRVERLDDGGSAPRRVAPRRRRARRR